MTDFKRREFLKASAAFAAASAAGGFGCVEIASAAPIDPPVVDRVSVRVLIDGAYNLFLRPGEVKGVKIEPAPRQPDYRRALHNQWGLSLYLEVAARQRAAHHDARLRLHARSAAQQHRTDRRRSEEDRRAGRQPRPLRPLRRPARLPRQVPRRAAGRPEALRRRRGQFLPAAISGAPGQLTEFGVLDRRELASRNVKTVLCESPRRHRPRLHHRQDQAHRASKRCCRTRRSNSP